MTDTGGDGRRRWIAVGAVVACAAIVVAVGVSASDDDRAALRVRSIDGDGAATATTLLDDDLFEVPTTDTTAVPAPTTTASTAKPKPPAAPAATTTTTTVAAGVLTPLPKECAAGSGTEPAASGDIIAIRRDDGIHELSPDGSRDYLVPGTDARSGEPAWSSDGRWLAVSQKDYEHRTAATAPSANLVVHEIATRCRTRLSDQTTVEDRAPTWASDGKRLAFLRDDHAKSVPPSGGAVTELAPTRGPVAWAPDGSGRFAVADMDGIKIHQPDGQVVAVAANGGAEFLEWAPDGSKIVFSISVRAAVWVVNGDGSNLHKATPEYSEWGVMVFWSTWSPDSKTIAFLRPVPGSGPNSDVWLVEPDGSNLRALTTSHTPNHWLQWSPSGREIAYDNGASVMAVAVDGGATRVVTQNGQLLRYFRRR